MTETNLLGAYHNIGLNAPGAESLQLSIIKRRKRQTANFLGVLKLGFARFGKATEIDRRRLCHRKQHCLGVFPPGKTQDIQ